MTLYDHKILIDLIASDNVIDAAYQWMCEKRTHHHFNLVKSINPQICH